jgi:hypothetical protein
MGTTGPPSRGEEAVLQGEARTTLTIDDEVVLAVKLPGVLLGVAGLALPTSCVSSKQPRFAERESQASWVDDAAVFKPAVRRGWAQRRADRSDLSDSFRS